MCGITQFELCSLADAVAVVRIFIFFFFTGSIPAVNCFLVQFFVVWMVYECMKICSCVC